MKKKNCLAVFLVLVLVMSLFNGSIYATTVRQNMLESPGLTNFYPTNTFYGYVGCRFTVKEPVTVTSFGAPYIEGNSATTVKIFEYSGGPTGNIAYSNFTELSAGIVLSNSATTDENGYNYSTEIVPVQPVILLPNRNYLIVLIADVNYKTFYDKITKPVANSVVTVENSVFGDGSTYFMIESGEAGDNYSFAKPTFTFNKTKTTDMMTNPGLTSYFPTNGFYGYVGTRFTVNETVSVTSLGAPYIPGNAFTTVKIFEYSGAATGNLNPANFTEISAALVYNDALTVDKYGYNYSTTLYPSAPPRLVPGKNYALVLISDANYPTFYDKITKPVPEPAINILNSIYGDGVTYFAVETGISGDNYSFAKPTFKFTRQSGLFNDYDSSTLSSSISTIYKPSANGVFYPRMEKLGNGRILCTFDTNEDDVNVTSVKVVYSDNGGQSFSTTPVVIASESGKSCSTAELFVLDNGNIWCSYRVSYQSSGTWYTSLKVKESTDNGATWNPLSTGAIIASETATDFRGVWEPVIGKIGGNIVCMYANDGASTLSDGSYQYIQMKTYNPSTGWSSASNVTSSTTSRDGMPVFTQLADGRYITVYECTDLLPAKYGLKYKISSNGTDWSAEGKIIYTPVVTDKRTNAPYITSLPNGDLLLTFQSDKDNIYNGDVYSKSYCMTGSVNGNNVSWTNEQAVTFVPNANYSAMLSSLVVDNSSAFIAYCSNYPSDGLYYRNIDISQQNPIRMAIQNFDRAKFGIRNDYTGQLGFMFSPSGDITVSHLGAPYFEGATQTTEYVYKVLTDGTDSISAANTVLVGSSVININLNTVRSDGFNYTQLQSPLKLTGGEKYLVVYDTSANNPKFYDKGLAGSTVAITSDTGINISTNIFLAGTDYIKDTKIANTIFGTPNFLYRPTPSVGMGSYKQSNGYVSNISKNTTVGGFISSLTKVSSEVTLKNGSSTLGNSALVSTGTRIVFNIDGQLSYQTAVIYGDVDKTGTIDVSDLAAVKSHLLKSSTLAGIAFKAADTKNKGSVTISDLVAVKKEIIGVASINQNI